MRRRALKALAKPLRWWAEARARPIEAAAGMKRSRSWRGGGGLRAQCGCHGRLPDSLPCSISLGARSALQAGLEKRRPAGLGSRSLLCGRDGRSQCVPDQAGHEAVICSRRQQTDGAHQQRVWQRTSGCGEHASARFWLVHRASGEAGGAEGAVASERSSAHRTQCRTRARAPRTARA